MSVSGSLVGLICFATKPTGSRLADSNSLRFTPQHVYTSSVRFPVSKSSQLKCCASLGMNQPNSTFNDSPLEPFWVTLSKEAIWGVRTLVMFLVEQPGQLKHIEWPSFQSTLKTATLTLVLVALLIVALTTVDSALCYLLTLLLRKSA